MRVVFQQTILMKYHALLVIFEEVEKFEIVVCCKSYVALYGLKLQQRLKQLEKKKMSNQVRLSLIFLVKPVRYAWGLKQIPLKNDSNRSLICDFQAKICLLVNDFLIRSLSKSR